MSLRVHENRRIGGGGLLELNYTEITLLDQKVFFFLRNSKTPHVSVGTIEGQLSQRFLRICRGDNDASWLSRRNEETKTDAPKDDIYPHYTITSFPTANITRFTYTKKMKFISATCFGLKTHAY